MSIERALACGCLHVQNAVLADSLELKFQQDGNCGRLLERMMEEEEEEDNQSCEGGWGFVGTIFLLLPSKGKFSQYSTLPSWFHNIPFMVSTFLVGITSMYVLRFVEWKMSHWRTYVVGNILSPFIEMNVGTNIQSHHLAFPITIFVQLHNPLVLVATHHLGFHHS